VRLQTLRLREATIAEQRGELWRLVACRLSGRFWALFLKLRMGGGKV
jgi:hypothetical protein